MERPERLFSAGQEPALDNDDDYDNDDDDDDDHKNNED